MRVIVIPTTLRDLRNRDLQLNEEKARILNAHPLQVLTRTAAKSLAE